MTSLDQNQPPTRPAPVLEYSVPGRNIPTESVRSFGSPMEANLARAAIEGEGINTQLVGETANSVWGSARFLNGRIDILVSPEDLEKAKSVLQQIDDLRAHRLAVARSPCPHCGGLDSLPYDRRRTRLAGVLGVVMLVAGIAAGVQDDGSAAFMTMLALFVPVAALLVMSVGRRTCLQCGHTWPDSQTDEDAEDKS